MNDFKLIELARAGAHINFHVSNVGVHPLDNRRQKSVKLRGRSLGDDFHAAIGQVAHEAAHVEVLCQLTHRVPEANPLDVAAVKRLTSLGGGVTGIGHARGQRHV